MMRVTLIAVATFSGLAASSVAIANESKPEEARQATIRFADNGGIRDWASAREDKRDILYIQDRSRKWYRASFIGSCSELTFANAIGFKTDGTGSLDRFSSIIADGNRCQFYSLTATDGPPKRKQATAETASPKS
jgi:hypothetical protein